jgi:hypothetical protein
VQLQRVGACRCRVGHPQQLEELLAPRQAPVSRALAAMRLSGVQHPPVVFKAPRRPTRIGHHAEDVIEVEHGYERR